MKRQVLIFVFFLTTLIWIGFSPTVFGQTTDKKPEPASVPMGWKARGLTPQDYEMFADSTVHYGGKASATLKAKESATKKSWGTLLQGIWPDEYRGKRVRLSGYLKSVDAGWAAFWMRIDSATFNTVPLAFDNMDDRRVKGTTDWKKYELVLDVPSEASLIAFGVMLGGKGQIWVDDLQLEVVGHDVASTDMMTSAKTREFFRKEVDDWKKQSKPEEIEREKKRFEARNNPVPKQPVNLNFEQ
jgi:hypothetical protein